MQQQLMLRPKGKGSKKIMPRQASKAVILRTPKLMSTAFGPKGGKPFPKSSQRRISAPVSKGVIDQIGSAQMSYAKNGDTRVVHREYLGEVVGSAAFSSTQYRIQPGSTKTFPWLSSVARRFDKYRFNRLKFCYETDCATSTPGTVMLVPDYDSSDAAPISKVQALSYRDASRGQAWTPFCGEVTRENLHALPQYYIAGNAPPAGTDIKTYQVGNMFLCVSGFTSTPTVGELWVEYDVTLIAPDAASLSYDSGFTVATAPTAAAPLGTALPFTAISGNVLGSLDISWLTGTTFAFNQAWRGLVVFQTTGTVLTGLTASGATVSTQEGDVINSAATSEITSYFMNALPGDVVTVTSHATTVSAEYITFAAA